MDLIRICALNSSSKEVMIVLQEAIECLRTCLDDEEHEDDENLVQRVIGIVALFSPAMSRSRLGKRSALDLYSPVLTNVASLITSVSPFATREKGRVLITEVARLVKSLNVWASEFGDADGPQEIKVISCLAVRRTVVIFVQSLLRDLLDTTVISCAPSIQASLAKWRDGEDAMLEVQVRADRSLATKRVTLRMQLALEDLGTTHWNPRSFSDLVYLAHSTPPVTLSPYGADIFYLLINALQMNMVVDESLFLLFRILTDENVSMSPDVATSLCTVLTALASTHLDPTIRQLNLRLLSLTLSNLAPPSRFEMLLKLTTDEDFPQMRGPAVGLLKESVLEALALPPDHAPRNPFASPELLRVFGGVLFRPNPPGFFNESKTREELAQSLELLRIADCLSFYYVLLQRDRENKTGVRSRGNVTSVQSFILGPLQRFLDENTAGEEQPLMAMLSLQVGLDRIEGALKMLDLARDT
ncbi:hypothetical protein J3R82DRAFT_6512 [Butyriboletus roseoflavus]|nr:hypothetical protein J3R82DRAFT_6512 [Butyriboletus roseoflavus]